MKAFLKIKSLLLIISVLSMYGCKETNEKHIGEWRAESEGVIGSLILDKTGHAVFVIGNQVLGGENFILQGNQGELKYEIDYSKSPIWLDLVIYVEGSTAEKDRIKGIVRFLTDNKMEYRTSIDENRFDKFDPDDTEDTMVFDRVSN